MEEDQQGSDVCPFREKTHGRSLAMCSSDVSREDDEGNMPRGITACTLLRNQYVVGLAAEEDRELIAAVQITRRNAPPRLLAHGVPERASQQQQQQQQRGGKEVVERSDVGNVDWNFAYRIVTERRENTSAYCRWVVSQGEVLCDRYTCTIEVYVFISYKLGYFIVFGWVGTFVPGRGRHVILYIYSDVSISSAERFVPPIYCGTRGQCQINMMMNMAGIRRNE